MDFERLGWIVTETVAWQAVEVAELAAVVGCNSAQWLAGRAGIGVVGLAVVAGWAGIGAEPELVVGAEVEGIDNSELQTAEVEAGVVESAAVGSVVAIRRLAATRD